MSDTSLQQSQISMTFSNGTQIGDYILGDCIYSSAQTSAWYARQHSVGRNVIFEILNPDLANDPDTVAAFQANIKAKAAIHLPHVSSIYESGCENGIYFYTHELLNGLSFQSMIERKLKLMPTELARSLKTVAETHRRLIATNTGSMPLSLADIYRDERGVTCLNNLAIAAPVAPQAERDDIALLGASLPLLLRDGVPGATRFYTMCSWMADRTRSVPLAWLDVQDLCETIESQLTRTIDPNATGPQPAPPRKNFKKWFRKNWPVVTAVAGGVGAICTLCLALFFNSKDQNPDASSTPPAKSPPKPLWTEVRVPSGKITSLNNQVNPSVPSFSIDSHEVTIEAYALFLKDLENPDTIKNRKLDQFLTEGKKSFEPGDWAGQLSAARNQSPWNGNVLTLRSPVTNIDLYDAKAYASWLDRRLPNSDEWILASEANFSQVPRDNSLDIDQVQKDKTANGSHGYAGRVREWIDGKEFDPRLPMDGKKFIILGGSILGGSTKSYEFVSNPLTRRPDVGFRTAKKSSTPR